MSRINFSFTEIFLLHSALFQDGGDNDSSGKTARLFHMMGPECWDIRVACSPGANSIEDLVH